MIGRHEVAGFQVPAEHGSGEFLAYARVDCTVELAFTEQVVEGALNRPDAQGSFHDAGIGLIHDETMRGIQPLFGSNGASVDFAGEILCRAAKSNITLGQAISS
jgi:hypothetical protein